MRVTPFEAVMLLLAGGLLLGALLGWLAVQRWFRPRWEHAVWWHTIPEETRRKIAAQAAAAQLDADALVAEAGPDDITTIIKGLPHIPAHEPPPGTFVPGMVIMTEGGGRAGWLEMELAGLRAWTHRITRGDPDD